MAEIALGRVISGPRAISRDTLMELAACAATGRGELGVGTGDAIGHRAAQRLCLFQGELCGAAPRRLQRAGQLARQNLGNRLCGE